MSTTDIESGPALTGKFTADLKDLSGITPPDVLRVADAFTVDFSWFLDGGLASSLGGAWYVSVAFESIGPGPEFRSPEVKVPADGRVGSANPYTATIAFPAGPTFPNGGPGKLHPGDRGTPYRVTALLNYTDQAGNPGPMAAAAELVLLFIYA